MVSITLDNVVVHLGRRQVVNGVSAHMEPGCMIGVIGPNGAGKSTLIRAIMGIVPYQGDVQLGGRSLLHHRRKEIGRLLAYLPQGQDLHWPLSVERLVALGRLPHLAPLSRISARDMALVEDAMLRADVMPLRDRVATELSGGERARVMLARALAVGAPVMIADEPLASLDPGHQIDVMQLLQQEARSGKLVIAVLHDLTMAARYCDRLLLIEDGGLLADDVPAKVLTSARLETVYGIRAYSRLDMAAPLIVPIERAGLKSQPD